MALNTPLLKSNLLQLLTDMETRGEDAKDEFAGRLAGILEAYIKTGSVAAGIPVATAGSATAQTGATTAPALII